MPEERRRIRVKESIYYRFNRRGERVYEVTYVDSDGRRRFQKVPGKLEDAQAALSELQSRLRKGDKVAPSGILFSAYADSWIKEQSHIRDTTLHSYKNSIKTHLKPALSSRKLSQVDSSSVLDLISKMREKGKSERTIATVLVPLRIMLDDAVGSGLIAANPVGRVPRRQRPKPVRRNVAIPTRESIVAIVNAAQEHCSLYHPIIATAAYSGLRLGELLGLQWADIGSESIRVQRQLGRDGKYGPPKTPQAEREVVLMPSLASLLRQHKLASSYSQPQHPVFASAVGTPLMWRNVGRRGLEEACTKAGVPRLSFHSLRHFFCSFLINEGLDAVAVSRQAGHASPAVTMSVYAHEFGRQEKAKQAREALEAAFGSSLLVNARSTSETASLSAIN